MGGGRDGGSGYDFHRPEHKTRSQRLIAAAICGHVDTMKQLILEGADKNAIDSSGSTALIHAAYMKEEKAVAYLLSIDADLNIANKTGETARSCAEDCGCKPIIALLNDEEVRRIYKGTTCEIPLSTPLRPKKKSSPQP